jgi:hypothetical protein
MALQKGVNSYSTVEEADAWFADRLDVAAWDAAAIELKSKALVTASSYLDNMVWIGIATDRNQPMAFPRVGTWFNSRSGLYENLADTKTPVRIIQATWELAYHLLNNEGLFDDTGRVLNLSIGGSINLEKIVLPSKYPITVKRLIKPLLRQSSLNSWWRAN